MKPRYEAVVFFTLFCHTGFAEWYKSSMKSYDFTVKSIEEIVAFKGTQKNDVNMFCESEAPRLAIHISLGHRDTVVCFWNSSKKSKNGPTSMIEISARRPIFPENVIFNHVLDICFKESVFFFNMFRHTGFTESYEWSRKWTKKYQNLNFSDFDPKYHEK